MNMDGKDILNTLKENNIKYINVCVIDLLGNPRCMLLTVKELRPEDFEYGLGFDGSSIIGYVGINESDLVAKPDPRTLVFDGISGVDKIAYILSFVYTPEEKPLTKDPRNIVKRFMGSLSREGKLAYVAPEMEFFLYEEFNPKEVSVEYSTGHYTFRFSSRETVVGKGYHVGPKKGYFAVPPGDKTLEFRKLLSDELQRIGIPIVKSHHEVASMSQIEINLKHSDPLTIADRVIYLKLYARILAERFGYRATFMPKPIRGDNGSGMHVHLSIWNTEEKNLFYDEKDEYAELSDFAKHFIGGILSHAPALAAIVAPTVNSYKRFVMGYEAPVFIAWSKSNRSALIRIPYYKRGDVKGKRIEVRFPDPMANPYFTFVSLVACGLDGVRKKINPGDPLDVDLYELPKELKSEIKRLPRDLWEALEHLESNNVIKDALGKDTVEAFLEIKRSEFIDYANQITLWEYLSYLNH